MFSARNADFPIPPRREAELSAWDWKPRCGLRHFDARAQRGLACPTASPPLRLPPSACCAVMRRVPPRRRSSSQRPAAASAPRSLKEKPDSCPRDGVDGPAVRAGGTLVQRFGQIDPRIRRPLSVAQPEALVRRREGFVGGLAGSEPVWTDADERLPADLAGAVTGSGPVIARGMLSGTLGPSEANACSADREP